MRRTWRRNHGLEPFDNTRAHTRPASRVNFRICRLENLRVKENWPRGSINDDAIRAREFIEKIIEPMARTDFQTCRKGTDAPDKLRIAEFNIGHELYRLL